MFRWLIYKITPKDQDIQKKKKNLNGEDFEEWFADFMRNNKTKGIHKGTFKDYAYVCIQDHNQILLKWNIRGFIIDMHW